jgi:hypothetical protein
MDYRRMQGQPRPRPFSGLQFRFDQRRRATLFGIAIALVGVAIILWPREHAVAPSQGDDIATLAKLINLPAMPVSAHWNVGPMSATDSDRVPEPSDWYLDATIVFSASDAAKISGAEAFYKSPLLTGKLMRIDDTHVRLILNTK